MKLLPAALACALYLCVPSVVFADPVPDPIVRLITEAVRTGNPATLATAVDLSKKTNPRSVAEIDALVAGLKTDAESAREIGRASCRKECRCRGSRDHSKKQRKRNVWLR